jgi:osmotically inducible lipoprotein OsmB
MFAKTTLKHMAFSAMLVTGLALSGCGTTPGERAVSGGLLGAGTGAAFGSITGNAGTGAVIGGVGGAAIGALTTPPSRYAYEPRCVRWSSYSGRCVAWR